MKLPDTVNEVLALPDEDFVQVAFSCLTGLCPDATTSRYYQARLAANRTKRSVLAQIVRSLAYRNREHRLLIVDDDVAFIDALYRCYLGRAPDSEGIDHFVQDLRNGAKRMDMLRFFASTQEALARSQFWQELEQLRANDERIRNWFWRNSDTDDVDIFDSGSTLTMANAPAGAAEAPTILSSRARRIYLQLAYSGRDSKGCV